AVMQRNGNCNGERRGRSLPTLHISSCSCSVKNEKGRIRRMKRCELFDCFLKGNFVKKSGASPYPKTMSYSLQPGQSQGNSTSSENAATRLPTKTNPMSGRSLHSENRGDLVQLRLRFFIP